MSTSRAPKPIDNFNRLIQTPAMQSYLFSTLHDKRDAFVANVTALVGGNPQLQQCDAAAVIMTAIKATALDLPLDPNLGFAYVVPYKSRLGLVPQFQLGYKGYIQLALRSGKFKTMNARDVREGEIIDEDFMSGELVIRKAESREMRPICGYLAYFELINGFRKSLYMSKTELEAHALRFSQTYKKEDGVWAKNFDRMAQKTVMKLLLSRYAPMSVEMGEMLQADGASFAGEINNGVYTETQAVYVDNSDYDTPATDAQDASAEPEQGKKPRTDYAKMIMGVDVQTVPTEPQAAQQAQPQQATIDARFSLDARKAQAQAQQAQQGEPTLPNLDGSSDEQPF